MKTEIKIFFKKLSVPINLNPLNLMKRPSYPPSQIWTQKLRTFGIFRSEYSLWDIIRYCNIYTVCNKMYTEN